MFAKSGVIIETISEQIISAGEKALLHLYKGTDDDNLDSLRYRMFCQKMASSRFHIKPEVLLPTSAAAKYHSFRVFHQVRLWMGENLSANEWGCRIKNKQMQPTKTDLGCAPSELLSLICCFNTSMQLQKAWTCLYSCLWRMSGTKLFKLIWSRNR